jgi:hypothetical protein
MTAFRAKEKPINLYLKTGMGGGKKKKKNGKYQIDIYLSARQCGGGQ